MNLFPASHPRAGLYAVYLVALLTVFGLAIGLQLAAPFDVVDYVSTGFTLPVFRYGLLLSLIACGVAISTGANPGSLAVHLAILAVTTCFALVWAEPIVLSFKTLTDIIARAPVVAAAMSMAAGSALLLSFSARQWLRPCVSAICGIGLGVSVILESPYDYYANWFAWAGGAGGLAIVVASIILTDHVRLSFHGSKLIIAERILGSWLVAASLMLAALSFLPPRPVEIPSIPSLSLDENNPS